MIDKIALWISIRANGWRAESAIISSNASEVQNEWSHKKGLVSSKKFFLKKQNCKGKYPSEISSWIQVVVTKNWMTKTRLFGGGGGGGGGGSVP